MSQIPIIIVYAIIGRLIIRAGVSGLDFMLICFIRIDEVDALVGGVKAKLGR